MYVPNDQLQNKAEANKQSTDSPASELKTFKASYSTSAKINTDVDTYKRSWKMANQLIEI